MANILSAEQLIELRQKACKKELPSFGSKEFAVTGTQEEKEKINDILSTTKALLSAERVEKSNLLSNAEWKAELKLAKVSKKVGKFFEILGHSINGVDYLFPEEALFMLENSNLELFFCGLPVSIQRCYSLVLHTETGCTLNEYRVYSYLSKNGYRVYRHDLNINKRVDLSVKQISELNVSRFERVQEIIPNADDAVANTDHLSTSVKEVEERPRELIKSQTLSSSIGTSELSKESRSPEKDVIANPSPVETNEFSKESGSPVKDVVANLAEMRQAGLEIARNISEKENKNEGSTAGASSCAINVRKGGVDTELPSYLYPSRSQRRAAKRKETRLLKRSKFMHDFNNYPRTAESLISEKTQHHIPFTQSKALYHDDKFAAIVEQFPTFENGCFKAHFPPAYLCPKKVGSQIISTIFETRTKKITHITKSDLPSSASTTAPKLAVKPFVTNFKQRSPKKKSPRGQVIGTARYFQLPDIPPKVRPVIAKQPSKAQRRKNVRRALRRMALQNEKSNFSGQEADASRNRSGNDSSSIEMGNVKQEQSVNSFGQNMVPPVAGQMPGAPDQTNQTLPPYGFPSQPQVKPEFPSLPFGNLNQTNMATPVANQTPLPFGLQSQPQQPQIKPEFPSQMNQQAMNVQSLNPLQDPNALTQIIANVVSQLVPNQMNPNLPNQMNPNFPNQMNPNFPNQMNPNFPNQMNPNFPNQMNPNFPNQMNPNFPNQMHPNLPNQMTPNFPNQMIPNFPNQMNPNFPNQMNPNFPNQPNSNFSNQGNFNFSNQGNSGYSNQNFNPRYPGQRFSRPFNNYGNPEDPVSEVTRHARKMHGMARRMLRVAEAMFKNPEEFTENPQNINIFNYSNRFRNPNGTWNNNNYRNNYRPRFECNSNNYNQNPNNFNQNSNNFNQISNNFNQYSNNFNQNSPQSFNPNPSQNFNRGNFGSPFENARRDNDEVPHFSSNTSNPRENSAQDEPVERKFNPRATNSASNSTSVSSNPGKNPSNSSSNEDNLFFVDVTGENPSNLLSKARTIPASEPTISLSGKKPPAHQNSSSSSEDSSDSESESENEVEVIESAKKNPEIVDVLSSDEEIFSNISLKINQTKQKANQICSKLGGKNLKTKNPDVIEIGGLSKKRKLNTASENVDLITLDDDDEIVTDCESVFSKSPSKRPIQNTSSDNCSNVSNAPITKSNDVNEPIVQVKQEQNIDAVIKTEKDLLDSRTSVDSSKSSDVMNTNIEGTETNVSTMEDVQVKKEISEDATDSLPVCDKNSSEKTSKNVSKPVENDTSKTDAESTSDEEESEDSEEDVSSNHPAAKITTIENDTPIIRSDSKVIKSNVTVSSAEKPQSANLNVDVNNSVQQSAPAATSSNSWTVLKATTETSVSTEMATEGKSLSSETAETDVGRSDRLKNAMKIAGASNFDDNGSKSLLQPYHCKNLGTVLNALQIFKSNPPKMNEEPLLKVSFDVYQPKKVFGKASRPEPDFRIIVTGYLDPIPSVAQVNEVISRFSQNIKIYVAVVHPSSISFFLINNVSIPVQIDEPLF